MPNPIEQPDLYDVILLAGQRSPGQAIATGAGSPRNWDERKGYGLSGAFLVFTGDGLAKFQVRLLLWEPQHFAEWESFSALLARPQRGTRPKALDYYHPYHEPLGIKSAVVEDVLQQDQVEPGLWAQDIKFIQYREPRPYLAKPEGSTATLNEPKAEDAYDKSIQYLKAQYQNPTDDLGTVFSRALGGG
ncbi:uncharacterized protein SOCEGT47_038740 [Sorangium cellulosum]|uniref:Uncharacterized protein n=1 Tax=Sorangium cellulosum TaxID=56 RepID=A0A4P2Q2L2_SORCE|nr:hypothetical protein [Sorangium cellulosum]AUX23351.1 uncharacterized protein SOCEGT47_038740 [Sorangium cellulosum]